MHFLFFVLLQTDIEIVNMKRIWVYLLGVLTGIIISVLAVVVIGAIYNIKNDPAAGMINGMSFFDKPGDIIEESEFRVFQALDNGTALARGEGGRSVHTGITVLLYNKEGNPYYDEQIIKVPDGKCVRQIGLYRYTSRMDVDKTVPVVEIVNK